MSRHSARARTAESRASFYQEITDKIIAELEVGRVPWVQPWGSATTKRRSRCRRRRNPASIFRPQGAKLIGDYDSQISFGQDRVLLVWTRLILPNGRSIVLERQPGAEAQGFAGLEDEVDYHWGRLFEAAALSTLLGVGSELGATNNDNAIVQALGEGSSNSLNQTGQQVVGRNLNVQPTITIRPGFPVRVIVNRDLVLVPYQPVRESQQ
jgi:type IV secretory pathway VirB10-like protein